MNRRGYVEVPAHRIREVLLAAGFRLMEGNGYSYGNEGEEVYFRAHDKDASYAVKVFSSITRGRQTVRGVGQDAIRVVAVRHVGSWVGVWKGKRIHRTGSVDAVLERMMERARDAYAHINLLLKRKQKLTGVA